MPRTREIKPGVRVGERAARVLALRIGRYARS